MVIPRRIRPGLLLLLTLSIGCATTASNPLLLGASEQSYRTIPLRSEYIGEDAVGGEFHPSIVYYMDEQGRHGYEVFVSLDGVLVDCRGRVLDTDPGRSAHGGKDLGIFVMGPKGRIYLSYRHDVGVLHHSSFLAGGPVAAAGEMRIEEGVLELLTNRSGHYRPSPDVNDQVLAELKARGVDTANLKKDYIVK